MSEYEINELCLINFLMKSDNFELIAPIVDVRKLRDLLIKSEYWQSVARFKKAGMKKARISLRIIGNVSEDYYVSDITARRATYPKTIQKRNITEDIRVMRKYRNNYLNFLSKRIVDL